MRLDPSELLLLALLAASLHWLVARAEITRWLWGAQSLGVLARLLACAGCAGFWIGLGLGAAGLRPCATSWWWADVGASALLGVFVTPVAEGVLLWGLQASAISAPNDDEA